MSDSLASLGPAELSKVIGFAKLFNGQKSMSSDFALMQITKLMHWGPPVFTGIALSCQVFGKPVYTKMAEFLENFRRGGGGRL